MHAAKKAGIAIQVAGVVWAGTLALAGMWVLAAGIKALPVPGVVSWSAGIALLGCAQFIYMTLFADRLFPHVHPGLRLAAEVMSFGMFVVGTLMAALYVNRAW